MLVVSGSRLGLRRCLYSMIAPNYCWLWGPCCVGSYGVCLHPIAEVLLSRHLVTVALFNSSSTTTAAGVTSISAVTVCCGWSTPAACRVWAWRATWARSEQRMRTVFRVKCTLQAVNKRPNVVSATRGHQESTMGHPPSGTLAVCSGGVSWIVGLQHGACK